MLQLCQVDNLVHLLREVVLSFAVIGWNYSMSHELCRLCNSAVYFVLLLNWQLDDVFLVDQLRELAGPWVLKKMAVTCSQADCSSYNPAHILAATFVATLAFSKNFESQFLKPCDVYGLSYSVWHGLKLCTPLDYVAAALDANKSVRTINVITLFIKKSIL